MARFAPLRSVRRVFWRAVGEGLSTDDAAGVAGVSVWSGRRWFHHAGGMPPLELADPPSGRYLSLGEREEIAIGLAAGESLRAVARRLGRSPSSICREVARNRPVDRHGPRGYRAVLAQQKADARAARPVPCRV